MTGLSDWKIPRPLLQDLRRPGETGSLPGREWTTVEYWKKRGKA